MPASDADLANDPKLPFPPVTKQHILNCSCHYWHPKYRAITPKARVIPLSQSFISYLRADGIVLPSEGTAAGAGEVSEDVEFESPDANTSPRKKQKQEDSESDSDDCSSSAEGLDNDDDTEEDVSESWSEVHSSIKSTISDLGSKVVPKLNWSAPKDATFMNATNSMECRSANDIYLMLKSSDFITHDLEHAFDGCAEPELGSLPSESESDVQEAEDGEESPEIPYVLMLRKYVQFNPSVEFRCFVRKRRIIGICQRDLNHFDFLFDMRGHLSYYIHEFFEDKLKETFPDENFVFDVYIPQPHKKVWLVDINPWAVRTDPLLFSWLELLTMEVPEEDATGQMNENDFVRLSLNTGDRSRFSNGEADALRSIGDRPPAEGIVDIEGTVWEPEFRLVRKDDPEAYAFNTPQYSAHKLPKDVVEASQSGPGPLREFANQWKEVLNRNSNRVQ